MGPGAHGLLSSHRIGRERGRGKNIHCKRTFKGKKEKKRGEEEKHSKRGTRVTWNFSRRLSQMFSFLSWNGDDVRRRKPRERERVFFFLLPKWKTKKRLMTVSNRTSGRNRSQTSLAGKSGLLANVGRTVDVDKSPHVQACPPLPIIGGETSRSNEIHQYVHCVYMHIGTSTVGAFRRVRGETM